MFGQGVPHWLSIVFWVIVALNVSRLVVKGVTSVWLNGWPELGSNPKPKVDPAQRSLELERECGLVFFEVTDRVHWLWPGYWEYKSFIHTDEYADLDVEFHCGQWFVRPEGATKERWIRPGGDYEDAKRRWRAGGDAIGSRRVLRGVDKYKPPRHDQGRDTGHGWIQPGEAVIPSNPAISVLAEKTLKQMQADHEEMREKLYKSGRKR